MDLRPIGFILGFLVVVLSLAMSLPLLLSVARGDGEGPAFALAMGATLFVGGTLILALRMDKIALDRRQAFLLTSLVWLLLPIVGAVPLLLSSLGMDVADAVFESVSGLTTTGSTVLFGLDAMPPSILLWRSILQWLGGIGIIAMGIAILPFLRVGGMQMFRLESSDRSDKVVPRASQFTALLLAIYVGLSLLCAICYALAGMTVFEAVNHAMTTLSTGGYSTSDGSLGHFENPLIQWLGTIFMLSGGLPFVLYIQALRGRPLLLFRDRQVQALLALLGAVSLVLSFWLSIHEHMPWLDAIRLTTFNVTSVVTTTGYATADYGLWGSFPVVCFYLLTFVGGCSGSTAGGFKIYRFQVVADMVRIVGHRLTTPHGVFFATFNRKIVDEDVVGSVATFMVLFVATVVIIALGLAAMGLDLLTAISGAATAVANVGPGLGSIIGPAGNFAPLPDAAKWLLSLGMILGRLEIVTIAILAMPHFWRS